MPSSVFNTLTEHSRFATSNKTNPDGEMTEKLLSELVRIELRGHEGEQLGLAPSNLDDESDWGHR